MIEIDPSEITPEHVFMNRRKFMAGAAAMAAGAVLAACDRRPPATNTPAVPEALPTPDTVTPQASKETDELGDKLTPYKTITNYNNYYEFSLEKENVAFIAMRFKTRPWQVQVGGLARKPKTYDIEELLKFGQEERIYRLRCVEAWSMVVPWVGFPLRKLLEAVEPTSEARFVRFETIMAPEQMIGLRASYFPWPYSEGLRLDEAMHDLTILATGLYSKPLTPQNGAPIRLVVPWKYGFKYIKSIIKIDLVKEMPKTFWVTHAPDEYGFYANVNPNVDHPRWSQATERRLGEPGRRKTLMFNGYEEEVAALYKGMDLRVNY